MHYCRSLRFEDKPDYPFLRQVFVDLLHKEGYEYDYVFDWTIVDKIDKPLANNQNAGAIVGNGNTIEKNPKNYQPSMNVENASADNIVVGGGVGPSHN